MTLTAKTPSPGRPKDLEKRAAILEAAKVLFPARGYDGVSMDAIAQAAGVSKLTVYSHFQDKDTLFVEAVKAKCEDLLPSDLFVARFEGPVRDHLLRIARAFFRLITSEEAISMHRMMNTPGTTENTLRELFWNAGPRRVQEVFAQFLQARIDQGQLRIDDTALASSQFFSLLKGELHPMMACGLCTQPTPAEVARHIDATVEFFLRAYAA